MKEMCGICGFFKVNNSRTINVNYLETMCNMMLHRGPDGGDVWISNENQCGLGHRRLSIVDLSTLAAQPMCNSDGSVIISFNGEIYNHEEIRTELKRKTQYIWKTNHSDTEVILHAYEEWGIECLSRFRGMFAIAIYDVKEKTLYLVRDRLGIKPLYYHLRDGLITFASEIKAILKVIDRLPEIETEVLYDYLSYGTSPVNKTFYQGIFKVPAASVVKIKEGSIITSKYWDVLDYKTDRFAEASEEEICKALMDELKNSVEMRTKADVPVGTFLSGGIDSSAVTLLFENYIKCAKSFCVGYPNDIKSYASEYQYAEIIAALAQTEHHTYEISAEEVIDDFDTIFYSQDEPLGEHAGIPTYYVSKLAKRNGIKVVETGDGADELFFGYPALIDLLKIEKLNHIWGMSLLKKMIYQLGVGFGYGNRYYLELLRRSVEKEPLYWGNTYYTEQSKKKIFSEQVRNIIGDRSSFEAVSSIYETYKKKTGRSQGYDWISYLSITQRLPELLLTRVDKMSMAHSIECRVPFLDHKFVELAMDIPEKMKIKNYDNKYILKKALRNFVPDELLDRKKQGFGAPVLDWFKGAMGKELQKNIIDFAKETNLLDLSYVKKYIEGNQGWEDWYLLNLVWWWKLYYKENRYNRQ